MPDPPDRHEATVHGWGFSCLTSPRAPVTALYEPVTHDLLERVLQGLRRWVE
jgi:hypothetical protein